MRKIIGLKRVLFLSAGLAIFAVVFANSFFFPGQAREGNVEQYVNAPAREGNVEQYVNTLAQEGNAEQYVNALAQEIDPKVAAAVARIDGTPRRLLALRGYLRNRSLLASRWSWDAAEIARYKQSAEYRAALAEVEKVKARFAEENPGYSLEVNTEVRTLEQQLASWNRTASIATAAEALFARVQQELASGAYRAEPDAASLTRFRDFLQEQPVAVSLTVATPGLSQHGQLRAFDFHIKQGSRTVATTESSTVQTVWDAQGWSSKLKAAVTGASRKLSGPLAAPREPWHYSYVP